MKSKGLILISAALSVAGLVFCMAAIACAASVQISWNANTEGDLAGYKVYYGLTSGKYTTVVDAGNVTSYQVQNVPSEGSPTMYIAVTAYDTSGNESGYSQEVSVRIPDVTAPEPPKGVLARLIDSIVGWFKRHLGGGLAAKVAG